MSHSHPKPFDAHVKYLDDFTGPSLPMWTYASDELLELEYEECFLKTWQFVGVLADFEQPGDYIVFDMWRDSAIIMKGDDGEIRAFQNVCSHRASRLLDGTGCSKLIQCQYHAWTFKRDGSLNSISQPKQFPEHDKSTLGLKPLGLEIYQGMIFVKMVPSDCLSVAEQWAPFDEFVKAYRTDDLERVDGDFSQMWQCNWKLAWDNYAESYHIPSGHPGLQRMLVAGEEGGETETGLGMGAFRMRQRPSENADEARYQSLIHVVDHRVDDPVKRVWFQSGMHSNMGIEFSGECLWVFQMLPTAVDQTEIRYTLFVRKNMSEQEQELCDLNIKINGNVNDEDRFLVERIQQGANTYGYTPGPLSYIESSLAMNHKRHRERFPVCNLEKAPKRGNLAEINEAMKQ